jgi:hypothetical protein
MSHSNPPFLTTKEKSLFDTDMNLFSSPPPPNEKTSLLPCLTPFLYHHDPEEQDEYSPSKNKNSSDGNNLRVPDSPTAETATGTSAAAAAATAGDDAASTTDDNTMAATENESIQEQDDDDCDGPETTIPLYENLLQQAMLWTMEMRSLRDDIFMLQIRTAMKLDHLTMLGADADDDFDMMDEY